MSELAYGALCIAVDELKGKRHLLRLKEGGRFTSMYGYVDHSAIIEGGDGCFVNASKGPGYRFFYPTYSDYVMNIKRRAQIIYPKDSAAILMWGDIRGGQRVLESGIGQGAMSIALLQAMGGKGELVSYELREEFAVDAAGFIQEFYGEAENHKVEIRSVYDGMDGVFDRIVLDLPEPWHVVKHCPEGLRNGGIIVGYLPTILQAVSFVEHLKESGIFEEIETLEFTKRPWKIDGRSVRPEMWTYNHSAFIVKARKVTPKPAAEEKPEEADVAADEIATDEVPDITEA
ncbi:MAG: tRNA (adenine-N1)-methyltransferase [Denitrovibrio sp.]|nr:MAG: tRNA (adenine-N1)-methyltransferase [Denitrovibrio sp.]